MEYDLKSLMFDFSITNEAELFSTNLSFKMNDEVGSKYIGEPGSKPEDSINRLTLRLDSIK